MTQRRTTTDCASSKSRKAAYHCQELSREANRTKQLDACCLVGDFHPPHHHARAFYFFRQQNKLLHKHRIELSDSNTQLSSLNDALNLLNTRLIDTNKQRERLAKLYIDLCAKFIDRLSKFELLVRRKIKVGQVNDLLNMTSSSRLSDEDAATFLLQFDTAFLDMYPSFIEEFNALLKPEEQVKPAHSRSLTTELRIFALIRLGVKDSSEIASLLFYMPRTIYNYRSAFKNKALNRETFEEDVEKLCTVMPTTA